MIFTLFLLDLSHQMPFLSYKIFITDYPSFVTRIKASKQASKLKWNEKTLLFRNINNADSYVKFVYNKDEKQAVSLFIFDVKLL